MGQPVKFEGFTHDFGPPKGEEERCGRLPCFLNGSQVVSSWELTDEEIESIVKTRRVWLSVWSGTTVFPAFVGSESTTASVVADFGKVWR